jgi:hypothetical protein
MTQTRKIPSEAELLALLRQGRLLLPPVTITEVRNAPVRRKSRGLQIDAVAEIRWGRRKYRFAIACRSLTTPKALTAAIEQARRQSKPPCLPLVLVPYLSPERLATLEQEQVSGLDACGNGVLIVPDELFVYRTGAPNQFPRGDRIFNIYRRTSSLVARVFLLVPEFDSVGEAGQETARRGGQVTVATVSKVCSTLDNDLVIDRRRAPGSKKRQLRLLQPDKLLELLAENYVPPAVTRTVTGKYSKSPDELRNALAAWKEKTGERVVLTGVGSVYAYAVMAREPVQPFYCSDLAGVLEWLGDDFKETTRFANVTLLESRDDFVYFDVRPDLTASPIQTYLELSTGDKRDRETAEQVRRLILAPLQRRPEAESTDGPPGNQSA